jgi:hypothetical protein
VDQGSRTSQLLVWRFVQLQGLIATLTCPPEMGELV